MNRRNSLKTLIILGAGTSAGAAFLASCQDKASMALINIPLTGSQESLLSAMSEAIIPTTDFIGAKELESHKFVLMMTDEVSAAEEQNKFINGMALFEEACKEKYNSAFAKCAAAQQEEFLLLVEAKSEMAEDVVTFYKTVKRFTIQSFTSSEKYLTEVRHFSLVPKPFKGCVPVANV